MNERLTLPNVTIWACCWTPEPERIARLLRTLKYCRSIIDCPRFVLFSKAGITMPLGIELVPIYLGPGFNWNVFVNREVPGLISTEFAMSVHDDGFPIRPDLWSDDFLKYDYIGAPWPDGMVGNGGFNIESQKLLRLKLKMPPSQYDREPSDTWTCRVHRGRLEGLGISFAPTEVAIRFSTEQNLVAYPNTIPSFGFHGRIANPQKYAEGWRLIEVSGGEYPKVVQPKVAIVYPYSPSDDAKYIEFARRFLESYQANLPGIEHETVVVLNGVRRGDEFDRVFSPLPNLRFLEHDDSGWDLGAYQKAAREVPCDMMAFFGGSTYFNGQGWLKRMVEAFNRHGNAQYGTMGNRGNVNVQVWPHIRTTSFWMNPELMNAYPKRITKPTQRHPFEHGHDCFTGWVTKQGLKSWVVSWTGELLWEDWDSDPNGYMQGDQSNMIAGDRMCEFPYFKRSERINAKPGCAPPRPPAPTKVTMHWRPEPKPYRCFNP